jgi:oligoendopeptidase F
LRIGKRVASSSIRNPKSAIRNDFGYLSAPMSKVKALPPRGKVKPSDTWDLSSLFPNDAEWEAAFKKWEEQIPGYEKFRGNLGQSAEMLSACLQFDAAVDRASERLGVYAALKAAED